MTLSQILAAHIWRPSCNTVTGAYECFFVVLSLKDIYDFKADASACVARHPSLGSQAVSSRLAYHVVFPRCSWPGPSVRVPESINESAPSPRPCHERGMRPKDVVS